MTISQLTSMLANDPVEARKEALKVTPDRSDERRAKLIAGLDIALGQLRQKEVKPKRGWYEVDGKGVTLRPKVGRNLMLMHGEKFDYISSDKPFEAATKYFTELKKLAQQGKIDDWIEASALGKAGWKTRD